MARLPCASRDDLVDELEQIAERRRRLDATEPVALGRRIEALATLDEWDRDLREQLAEMA